MHQDGSFFFENCQVKVWKGKVRLCVNLYLRSFLHLHMFITVAGPGRTRRGPATPERLRRARAAAAATRWCARRPRRGSKARAIRESPGLPSLCRAAHHAQLAADPHRTLDLGPLLSLPRWRACPRRSLSRRTATFGAAASTAATTTMCASHTSAAPRSSTSRWGRRQSTWRCCRCLRKAWFLCVLRRAPERGWGLEYRKAGALAALRWCGSACSD